LPFSFCEEKKIVGEHNRGMGLAFERKGTSRNYSEKEVAHFHALRGKPIFSTFLCYLHLNSIVIETLYAPMLIIDMFMPRGILL